MPPDKIVTYPAVNGVFNSGKWSYLTKRQFQIFEALYHVSARSMNMDQLIHKVYASDPDGGPDDPRTVIHVLICQANKKLKHSGLAIQRDRKGAWYAHYRVISL